MEWDGMKNENFISGVKIWRGNFDDKKNGKGKEYNYKWQLLFEGEFFK